MNPSTNNTGSTGIVPIININNIIKEENKPEEGNLSFRTIYYAGVGLFNFYLLNCTNDEGELAYRYTYLASLVTGTAIGLFKTMNGDSSETALEERAKTFSKGSVWGPIVELALIGPGLLALTEKILRPQRSALFQLLGD